jgi:hypothetical protein
MHVAYSALKPENNHDPRPAGERTCDSLLRYMAYLEACEKYRQQIVAIRKYFPGWAPSPPSF